jgi:anti-sigma regulatory factor (Ser/Thr protein kinase)
VLTARPESVKAARTFTRTVLHQWELGEYFDDVALVASELVTNALRHALPAVPVSGPDTRFRLHLMHWPSRLVCAVRDPSGAEPVLRGGLCDEPDFSSESGRGLRLVEAVSNNWGWYPLAGPLRGKVVWSLFGLPVPGGVIR